MVNYRFKKADRPVRHRHDPSFYDRFNMAWANLQEYEVDARLRLLAEPRPARKLAPVI